MQLTNGRPASGPGPARADLLVTPASELLRAATDAVGSASDPSTELEAPRVNLPT